MEGRPIEVHGISMRPYINSQDLFWIVPVENQNFSLIRGQLVYAIQNESQEYFVHRVIRPGQIKGDRVKQFDNDLPGGYTVLGIVQGRLVFSKSKELSLISYHSKVILFLHQIQSYLSEANQWKNKYIHRFASVGLILVGICTRNVELCILKFARRRNASWK